MVAESKSVDIHDHELCCHFDAAHAQLVRKLLVDDADERSDGDDGDDRDDDDEEEEEEEGEEYEDQQKEQKTEGNVDFKQRESDEDPIKLLNEKDNAYILLQTW